MKKLFTLFFVLSLACSAFAGTYYYDGKLVYYLTTNGTDRFAHVCKPSEYTGSTPVTPYTGNIVIPDSISTSEEGIDAYEVRYIDSHAFENSTITSVSLPAHLEYIIMSAFNNCTQLVSVTMRSGRNVNLFIENNAFTNCTNLTTFNVPTTYSIGENAFLGCTNLQSFDFSNVKYIYEKAFYNCRSLTSVNLTGQCNDIISSYSFYGCTSLTYVSVGDAYSIREFAFANCSLLGNINLPEVNAIHEAAFYNCENLKTVTLNSTRGISNLGPQAFERCTKLEKIFNLDKSSLISLPNRAFANCYSLKSIDIPGDVRSISNYAFENCRSLRDVDLDTCTADIKATMFKTCDNLEMFYVSSKNKRYSGGYGLIDKTTKTLVVGTTNGNLGDKIIASLYDPIETIGDSAYVGRKITSITLPLTLKYIKRFAFYGTPLTYIYIPDNVEIINSLAFANSSLRKIVIGQNIRVLENPFGGTCNDLNSLVLTSTSTTPIDADFTTTDNANIVVEVDSSLINIYKNDSQWSDMNIVECDEYDNGFFYYLDNNEAIITTIDTLYNKCYYSLFQNDTIVIPEYVSYQGVNYPVSKIGYKAFYYTSNISKYQQKVIKLPSNLKEIDDLAFYSTNVDNVIFNDGLKTIGKDAFALASLKKLNLPTSVTEIGEGAFSGNFFTSVSIPNNVTTIKKSTFSTCPNLERINIGKKVTNIEKNAFIWSPNIRTITCKNVTPAVFESTTFTDNFVAELKDSARLIVPEEALADYQNAPVWQEFLNIRGSADLNPTAVEEAVIENLWVENGTVHYDGEFRIYDIVGRDVTNLNGNLKGIYIIRTKDAVQKVSITK